MTDESPQRSGASSTEERLARLSARRPAPTPVDQARPQRRRPAEASRWLVAAASAAAGFGMVAAFGLAADQGASPPVVTGTVPPEAPATPGMAQPIIVINTGTPITGEQAAELVQARVELPQAPVDVPTPPTQVVAESAVTTTAGS